MEETDKDEEGKPITALVKTLNALKIKARTSGFAQHEFADKYGSAVVEDTFPHTVQRSSTAELFIDLLKQIPGMRLDPHISELLSEGPNFMANEDNVFGTLTPDKPVWVVAFISFPKDDAIGFLIRRRDKKQGMEFAAKLDLTGKFISGEIIIGSYDYDPNGLTVREKAIVDENGVLKNPEGINIGRGEVLKSVETINPTTLISSLSNPDTTDIPFDPKLLIK